MWILGISAYHGDSAAALLGAGRVVAAVEEERFRRVKHWAGYPSRSIAYCLEEAGIGLGDVDHIAVSRDPRAQIWRKVAFVLRNRTPWSFVRDRLKNRSSILGIENALAEQFGSDVASVARRLHNVEHHLAHAASTFYFSPFEESAILSVDAFGDWTSTMLGVGTGVRIEALRRTFFPHSLGTFYSAITQFLGFHRYGDEYKVMGLAAYGEPVLMDEMRILVKSEDDGRYHLDLRYFAHQTGKVEMRWQGDDPGSGLLYSPAMEDLLGPSREPGAELETHHKNIAASLQQRYEEVFLTILRTLHEATGTSGLCLAGGCAMNSLANGKVLDKTPFERVFVPPQPGDAGGAIGAAAVVHSQVSGQRCIGGAGQAYLGPHFDDQAIEQLLDRSISRDDGFAVERVDHESELCSGVARDIADGKVIGWFQGRTEWGPRALGNRSILADPRRADIKEILNSKIKRRESFRPFAPSILRERTGDYFETDHEVPYMSMVFEVRRERRADVPSVIHVDGTGRLQTVDAEENRLYWKLIKTFEGLTGVPMVLNTSFNENEPIVCTPAEALDCFLRTRMDTLVLGQFTIRRHEARSE